MRASFMHVLKGPCISALQSRCAERWGEQPAQPLPVNKSIYKNMARAISLTPKWPLRVESRHACSIYAAPALLRVTEAQRNKLREIFRVKNLLRRDFLCSTVLEVNFRASKSYYNANYVTEGICGKPGHRLALLTSSPMLHTDTARSCSDLILQFVSDLQVLSPEKEPLCLQEKQGLCAWRLTGRCCPPGICIVDHETAWHKIQGIKCNNMVLQRNVRV